ncbi:uncharacterized protein RB166_012222 [Leptodactylus fuscus]|uniref:uncharacterized protein LOC142210125 n=1 Tax=Leptodactylus fuscus TaxID=238119 RepID=UPI003F4EA274
MGSWIPRIVFLLQLLYSVHPCIYFYADDLTNQTLVISREREDYCIINKTVPNGDIVQCEGNATASRVNTTHVRLKTNEGPDVNFILNHGRDNERGKHAEPYNAACPADSAEMTEVQKKTTKPRNRVYTVVLTLCALILGISLSYVIYQKYRRPKRRRLMLKSLLWSPKAQFLCPARHVDSEKNVILASLLTVEESIGVRVTTLNRVFPVSVKLAGFDKNSALIRTGGFTRHRTTGSGPSAIDVELMVIKFTDLNFEHQTDL